MTPMLVLKLLLCPFPGDVCLPVPPKDQHYFSSRILCENAALQAIWDGFRDGYRVRSAECKLVWVEMNRNFGALPPVKPISQP